MVKFIQPGTGINTKEEVRAVNLEKVCFISKEYHSNYGYGVRFHFGKGDVATWWFNKEDHRDAQWFTLT